VLANDRYYGVARLATVKFWGPHTRLVLAR